MFVKLMTPENAVVRTCIFTVWGIRRILCVVAYGKIIYLFLNLYSNSLKLPFVDCNFGIYI